MRGYSAGRPANLTVAYHDIVMVGTNGLDTHLPQYQQQHIDEAVEGKAHLLLFGDERQHQVVAIGIDTASPTLPVVQLDSVGLAVCQIHLILYYLITAIDNAGGYLPQEKSIASPLLTGHILLHRQKERQLSCVSNGR